jgi:hypothetical protein
MAKYLVKGQRHFRGNRLYEIGEVVEIDPPIANIKEWIYLELIEEPKPPAPAAKPS